MLASKMDLTRNKTFHLHIKTPNSTLLGLIQLKKKFQHTSTSEFILPWLKKKTNNETKEWARKRRHELEKPFAMAIVLEKVLNVCCSRWNAGWQLDSVRLYFSLTKHWQILIWMNTLCWMNAVFISATVINNNDNTFS